MVCKIYIYSSRVYDENSFNSSLTNLGYQDVELFFNEHRLTSYNAFRSSGYDVVCAFVNDDLSREVLKILSENGTKIIAMRCAGFEKVDLDAAKEYGLTVIRVPSYSPESIGEYAVGLSLALNRKICLAYNKVKNGNFSISHQMGFNYTNSTVGILGTGLTGKTAAKIFKCGFGARVIAYDAYPSDEVKAMGVEYVSLEELFKTADTISIHLPLLPATKYIVNESSINMMKKGVIIVNVSRGGLVNTKDVVEGLKSGKIGGYASDVYENEAAYFFEDRSEEIMDDDLFARLLSFKNVIVSSHQAFLTHEALKVIADTTITNCRLFFSGDKEALKKFLV